METQMKNRLIAAVLMLTPFFACSNQQPSFAEATAGKPTKVEFLAYLNNVQVAVKKNLEQLSYKEKILEQKFSDYNVSKKVLNELSNHPQQQSQFSKIEKLLFGLFCYKIRSLEDITFVPKNPWVIPTNDLFTFFLRDASKEDEQFFFDLSAELDIDFNRNISIEEFVDEQILMNHLKKTLVKKYCHKNDTRTIKEKMKSILRSYESLELSTIIDYTKILAALLQDIESKIQELQKA